MRFLSFVSAKYGVHHIQFYLLSCVSLQKLRWFLYNIQLVDIGGYVLRLLCKKCWNLVVAKKVGEWDKIDGCERGKYVWNSIFQSKARAKFHYLATAVMNGAIDEWDMDCMYHVILGIYESAEKVESAPEHDTYEWNLEHAKVWNGEVKPGTLMHVQNLMLKRQTISSSPRVEMSDPDFIRESDILKSTLVDLCCVQDDRNRVEDQCALIKSYRFKCDDLNPTPLPGPYPPPEPQPPPRPPSPDPDGVGHVVSELMSYI
jgi:hypothetical protein